MPKYCSVPNCKNDSGNGGDRKSFYKFPLQDPVRLQRWLRNMRRGDWTPSRHQYICHEHFAPSCFKVRWGIRYLESDAVPTVFQEAEKRKASDPSEWTPKRLRTTGDQSVTVSGDGALAVDAAETESKLPRTVRLYEITVDPSQQAETSRLEASGVGGSDRFPFTLLQAVNDLSNGEEVIVMSECPAGERQDELLNGIILTRGHGLVSEDGTAAPEEHSDPHEGDGGGETQVIAYFETMPNILPGQAVAQLSVCPDMVLSSALSSKPITSTLPIVSKHTAPSPTSLVLTVERLDTDVEEGDDEDGATEDEEELEEEEELDGGPELLDRQLEEHCYHKSSLSKEQLEAIVGELQKKVKVLQQRHRRHLEKLLGLENTVSQLRQSNLLNEERLQLLERAYIQTSAAGSDAGGTVAIIYEMDDAAYLYTPLIADDGKL
ncbi:THAP domain-containing protein 5-like [Clinocottus analis]|uniref:THAP domain-containing protein 5-like n=1 Tax=Clinocottus analis TaxID=304258 RepID=UPI0035BF573E